MTKSRVLVRRHSGGGRMDVVTISPEQEELVSLADTSYLKDTVRTFSSASRAWHLARVGRAKSKVAFSLQIAGWTPRPPTPRADACRWHRVLSSCVSPMFLDSVTFATLQQLTFAKQRAAVCLNSDHERMPLEVPRLVDACPELAWLACRQESWATTNRAGVFSRVLGILCGGKSCT